MMNKFTPIKQEKSVISIRIDNDLLRTIDDYSIKTDISRNEFIVQCIEFAIQNITKDI
ncbi:CopG family transcriptional regulator [bacterium]|nr:CopG family transcriptional regulator [bacterium]